MNKSTETLVSSITSKKPIEAKRALDVCLTEKFEARIKSVLSLNRKKK